MQAKIVRVYLMESDALLHPIMNYLRNEAKVRGATVFRAISGFGVTGQHSAELLTLSLNLPLVIEFFDAVEKTNHAIQKLSGMVKNDHIISWPIEINCTH